MRQVIVKEASIEEALKVNSTVTEFYESYLREHFEERCKEKESLIIVGYLDNQSAGYIVGYDRYGDGSFYCWMAGVNPEFRRNGVLRALMDYQIQWAQNRGYTKIKIKTRNNRREMLAFLVKAGFNFVEVERQENIEDNRIALEKGI